MVDIMHRIGVVTPDPTKVYEALTTIEGLSGWWTDETSGDPDLGGTIEFRFAPVGGFDLEVLDKMSLKSLVETGIGAPAPRDVQISDWH